MFRLAYTIAALLALVCACSWLARTKIKQAEDAVDFPLSGDIRGSDALLSRQPARIVIGEIHGTVEIPRLVAVLVRTLSAKAETVLCLEMSASQQQRLDAFLKSDGGGAAVRALLSGEHWLSPDGRASTSYLEMLQLVRELARRGRPVRLAAIDADLQDLAAPQRPFTEEVMNEFARKRDQQMADNVQQVVAKYPGSNVVVLVGNLHASVQLGVTWDAEYKPLGWHLKQKLPGLVSLNYQSSGGEAWLMGETSAGPRSVAGTSRGDQPFVELYDATKEGFDGILYVGRLTASPPAKEPQPVGQNQQSPPPQPSGGTR